MCTLVVAELWAPGASHREKGLTRESSIDRDRDDIFVKISFSYWGFRLSPGTCKTYDNPFNDINTFFSAISVN